MRFVKYRVQFLMFWKPKDKFLKFKDTVDQKNYIISKF